MLSFFKNLGFRKKIFVVCLLVSLIPVAILGGFCYRQVKNLLINRERTALTESLVQESNTLRSKISGYENIMHYILWDNNIHQALSRSYHSNFDMYIAYRDTIDPSFTTMKALNRDVKSITLYTDIPMNPHGTMLRPLSEISQADWYPHICQNYKPLWTASMEEQTLSLVCQFSGLPSSFVSIVKIDFHYSRVFSSMESLYEQSYGILLADGQGTPVYQYSTFPDGASEEQLAPQELIEAAGYAEGQKNHVIEMVPDIFGGWSLYLYRPVHTIDAPARRITQTVLIIIFFCVVCVILLSSFLSSIIVRPLEHLMENMQQVEQGKFTITVTYDSSDEIGRLMNHFRNMVQQLHHLVNEVLKSKILQQEYEMRALQAQINPHFLYNSLSLINSRALMADQEEISQMARLLSTFYRTTLNKGKNTISVKDELENIRSYISIQFLMHSNSFDVIYDIDEDILSLTMINLLLQPLVENAIMHGIDHRELPGRGLLHITGNLKGDTIQFQVSDNGPGIPKEQLSHILTSDSGGYGIQNVHHRIQLFYGPSYGLHYQSDEGVGTIATLVIPRQPAAGEPTL